MQPEFVDRFRNELWHKNTKNYCCQYKYNSYQKGIALLLLIEIGP